MEVWRKAGRWRSKKQPRKPRDAERSCEPITAHKVPISLFDHRLELLPCGLELTTLLAVEYQHVTSQEILPDSQ